MDNEKKIGSVIYPQSYLGKYIGTSPQSSKGKFEEKSSFRRGLSEYDMKYQTITPGSNCIFDTVNCSGVPMDYDEMKKCVYVDGSDAHTLLIGSTGSKKSRLVVIPSVRTIATAGEGMIICDPKGEIYNRTAHHLIESGYNIFTINLREPDKGDGWNLLEIPYSHFVNGEIDKACALINDATVSLMPLSHDDPYWDMSARDMLFGLILLLFYICKEHSLPFNTVNIINVIKLREELFSSTYTRKIAETNVWKFARKYYLVRSRLKGVIICPEKTLACIISTFDQHMACFSMQPQVMDMLSSSTFDINEIGFKKLAIFLVMPDEKTTYHKIVSIFLKQVYELLIDNAFKLTKGNRLAIRVNFILDEFSSLPAISDFPQMISASRSRNIRFLLVMQSKHQLSQRYKEETETIMSNCNNWMFLTSRETQLLNDLSELGGVTGANNQRLISVSWLQHLDKEKGECLIFSGRKYPYVAQLPDIDIYDGGANEVPDMTNSNRKRMFDSFDSDIHIDEGFFENLLGEENLKNTSDTFLDDSDELFS